MDLGFDSFSNEKKSVNDELKDVDPSDSFTSASKTTKNKSPKGSPPSGRNSLNKVASQIKKPPHRKTSPINWSPRRKVESFLKRKIKSLQEAGGMNDTLEETLGHANPHYCRVLREKIAAKEAACKVIEARKAAMVEASWCRILKAARIPTKEAEALLLKAEKEEAEAIEAAPAKGVIMYDAPDHPRKHLEIETSATSGNGSTTHTIKASFETAFEVDKQVAAAVKAAFIRLAHYSSFSKEEFKDLLRKISENPDTQELSETETETGLEVETVPHCDGSSSERKNRQRLSPQKYTRPKLVNMMLQRLKCLNEEELASLATIVATCGLNAALAETDTQTLQPFKHETVRTKHVETELPSLDKFLVRKLTRLEKEVLEAKNARKAELNRDFEGKKEGSESVNTSPYEKVAAAISDLGTEVDGENQVAKSDQNLFDKDGQNKGRAQEHSRNRQLEQEEVPSLDKFLVKHVTRLERAVQEAKNRQQDSSCVEGEALPNRTLSEEDQIDKENLDSNREGNGEKDGRNSRRNKRQLGNIKETQCESLDKCLVKHVSRLEREKIEFATKEATEVQKKDTKSQLDTTAGSLDQILVKHKSRLEREKVGVLQQAEGGNKPVMTRREAREKELLDTWGGMGLGTMRPHVSRLERDKAAWIKAEKDERRAAMLEQQG